MLQRRYFLRSNVHHESIEETLSLVKFSALIFCSLAVYAKEQHLKYEDEMEVYELVYDDAIIPASQMRQVAWLSPYWPDVQSPFVMLSSWDGTTIDRRFAIFPLDSCNPGYIYCGQPTLNNSFFQNARLTSDMVRRNCKLSAA